VVGGERTCAPRGGGETGRPLTQPPPPPLFRCDPPPPKPPPATRAQAVHALLRTAPGSYSSGTPQANAGILAEPVRQVKSRGDRGGRRASGVARSRPSPTPQNAPREDDLAESRGAHRSML